MLYVTSFVVSMVFNSFSREYDAPPGAQWLLVVWEQSYQLSSNFCVILFKALQHHRLNQNDIN